MNDNVFTSQRRHTRVSFHPLTTSCQLDCLTTDSPIAQTHDVTANPEFVPNRLLSPTVLYPLVRCFDPDRIFPAGAANQYIYLDSMQWIVNGKPINEVWQPWDGSTGDYEIITSAGDSRGTLRVYRNMLPTETATVQFVCQVLDFRTNRLYDISSDKKTFTTSEKSEDILALSIDKPEVIYDPLRDNLLLYEHEVSLGVVAAGNRANYLDEKAYEQKFTLLLTSGTNRLATLPEGLSMQVVRLVNGQTSTALTPNSESAPELLQASFPSVKLDMRLIAHNAYEVHIIKNNEVILSVPFTAQTKVSMPSFATPMFGADIPVGRKSYTNFALVNLPDKKVEYPELYYLILWHTQAHSSTVKDWQFGKEMIADTDDIGIINTAEGSNFDVWFDTVPHEVNELMTDESDVVLTDENDEFLIA